MLKKFYGNSKIKQIKRFLLEESFSNYDSPITIPLKKKLKIKKPIKEEIWHLAVKNNFYGGTTAI